MSETSLPLVVPRWTSIAPRGQASTVPAVKITQVDGQPELTSLAATIAAANDPLTTLEAICAIRALLVEVEKHQVEAARSGGATWAQVGERLGISKQGAAKRHGGPDATPVSGDDSAARSAVARKAPTQEPPVFSVSIRGTRLRLLDVHRFKL